MNLPAFRKSLTNREYHLAQHVYYAAMVQEQIAEARRERCPSFKKVYRRCARSLAICARNHFDLFRTA